MTQVKTLEAASVGADEHPYQFSALIADIVTHQNKFLDNLDTMIARAFLLLFLFLLLFFFVFFLLFLFFNFAIENYLRFGAIFVE